MAVSTHNIFFISDMHLGHKRVLEFEKENRPFSNIEEHNEELIKRWNSVVKKNDTVWVLGDFAFGKENLALAGRLSGTKRLVLGNHDLYPAKDYLQYFTRIFGAVKFENTILTHIPIHPSEFRKLHLNIHGHLHHKTIDDSRYFNVSVEQINLTPISFEEIKSKRTTQLSL